MPSLITMNTYKLTTLAALTLAATTLNAAEGFVLFGDNTEKPAAEEKFVRPVTAPYFHEDSFVTTDLRAWYLTHHFYGDTIKGDVEVAALQVRVALTEKLQFVAYKDGYTKFNDTLIDGVVDEGWNDIGAGLKWAFLQDYENQVYMAVGLGYEFGWGDEDVLQDTDEYRVWVSWNKGYDKLHLGATANLILADDEDEGVLGNADLLTLHFHADYYLTEWFSPVVEVNGYMSNGDALPFSGVDAVSINGGDGEDTWTGAIGAEFRPIGDDLGLRIAYETQINNDTSLFGHRWTASAVYEF